MSYQERVEPGRVNNLISFFENRGDDDSEKTDHRTTQGSDQTSHHQRTIVQDYFSQSQFENGTNSTQNEQIRIQKPVHRDSHSSSSNGISDSRDDHYNNKICYGAMSQIEDPDNSSYQRQYSSERFHYGGKQKTLSDQERIENDRITIVYQCRDGDEVAGEVDKKEEHVETQDADYVFIHKEKPKKYEEQVEKYEEQQSSDNENCAFLEKEKYESDKDHESDQERELHRRDTLPCESDKDKYQLESDEQQLNKESEDETEPQKPLLSISSEGDRQHLTSEELVSEHAASSHAADSVCHINYDTLPNHLKGYGTPTVYPAAYFDPEYDATCLKKATKGLGTNEKAIIDILTQRNNEQRQEIAHKYRELYGKDLVQELCKELSGNLEDIVLALMTTYFSFIALELHKAMKGAGTDERTLCEILCTCDDAALEYIKDAYLHMYTHSLQDDVYSDTSGDFRKVLLSILSAAREDPKSCSPDLVASQLSVTDAKGKPDLGSDVVRTVLVTYTRSFLYRVFEAYEVKTGKPFGELIDKVCSGDAKDALLALYKSIVCVPTYLAEELQYAMKGLGTKDSKLIRIIVSRAEIDLQDIKDKFYQLSGKELAQEVKSETSGVYRVALLALLEGCNKAEAYHHIQETSQESQL